MGHYERRQEELGHRPVPANSLPPEYLLMAIGNKRDRIFQGIIYGKPRHPLLLEAIHHCFGSDVLLKKGDLQYMVFCKYLYKLIRADLGQGQRPAAGWNICPRFGPIYLLQENFCEQLKQSKKLSNDGHHFVTASGDLVAFTRCWDWCKGFRGDVANRARDATQMLRSLPDAVADACWAAKSISSSSNGNEAPTGPTPEELLRYAEDAIADNLYERIMEAVHASRHYKGMTRDAVLGLIPRGLCLSSTQPGYLSCRHCISKSTGTNVDFPTSGGIKSHFLGRKRQSYHSCNSFLQHLLEEEQGQAETGLPCPR